MIILPNRAGPGPVIPYAHLIPASGHIGFSSGGRPRREKAGEAKLRDKRAQETVP